MNGQHPAPARPLTGHASLKAWANWLRAQPDAAACLIDPHQVAGLIEQYDECVDLLRAAIAERDRWIARQPRETVKLAPELDQLQALRAALRHCAAALHAIRDAESRPDPDREHVAHRAAVAEQIAREALEAIEQERAPA